MVLQIDIGETTVSQLAKRSGFIHNMIYLNPDPEIHFFISALKVLLPTAIHLKCVVRFGTLKNYHLPIETSN